MLIKCHHKSLSPLSEHGMSSQLQKIYFIEVLRGFSSLFVVAYHVAGVLMGAYSFWPGMGRDLFKNGNAGVDIFFMISGFIICFATQKKESAFRSNFLIRRFFRIYPLFIICLSIAWLTYNFRYPLSQYIYSSTLMLNDYSGRAPFFGYNMLYPAWTIAYEVLFYLVFFIAMSVSHKHRMIISSAIIVVSMVVIQLLFKGQISFYGGFSSYSESMGAFSPLLTMMGSPMMLEFVNGMFFYVIFSNYKANNSVVLACSFMILALASTSMFGIFNVEMHGITEKGAIAAAIFISFMFAEIYGLQIKSTLTKFFSDISYSLYITHVIVLRYYLDVMKHFGFSDYPKGIFSFVMIFIMCIAVAFIFHITIEKYFIMLGKRLISLKADKVIRSKSAY